MSVADSISFNNFCQLCTKVSEVTREKKTDVLQNYIKNWKKKAKDLKDTHPDIDDSFYPVLRLLLPQLDRERGAYGVKEHTLAKIYIRILSLPKDSRDAVKFVEYRAPKTGSEAGDFAEVAYWILKKRCAQGGQLSITEVNNHLDAIATKHASNDPRGVDSELISLLRATSAEEQKWLIRILLKDVKLGLGQGSIFGCYHLDARDLYDVSNNLRKVCDTLKNSEIRLHEIEIELFSPFRPMLSEECDFQKLDVYLKRSRFFYIETKLDGERFQLHMKNGEFKYFSRNGYDYTSNFGSSKNEGILTPRIANQFFSNVKSCILDGEMMSWNSTTGKLDPKGSNIDVKNLKEKNNHQSCFCVFDILFYNDEILTNKPLNHRLEILNEVVKPLEGSIAFVSRKRIGSKEEIVECLNEAIDNREEGVVMKEFMSVYKANVRKNSGWYKIKPDYVDGVIDTLDLLIIGGYFGSGRRKGISHFLLGVAVDVNEDSKLFYSVGRVGSGYTMSELEKLQSQLQPHWKPRENDVMPAGIEWAKEKPDVWVAPEKSFVLEIKAAEIMSSNFFKTGYTLRFPRVERVRYDKSWKDCMTLSEFQEKRKIASGKLARHYLSTGSEVFESVPKKKQSRSNITVATKFIGIDESNVEQFSNLLAGKKICVFTGFGEVSKNEVERKIVEFGGKLVQNPGKDTFCILAETDSTVRIKNVIQCGSHDVIKTSWFYAQLQESNKSLPERTPEDFLAMSEKTREKYMEMYDEFGDSYTVPVTNDSIRRIMGLTGRKVEGLSLSTEDKCDLDMELFSGPSPYTLFRLCVAYFDHFVILENPSSGVLPHLELFLIDFKFGGGKCVDSIGSEVTHVVVFSGDLSRLAEINRRNRERENKFHVVSEKWIKSSLANKSLSSDSGFD